jgi:tetratricopeptide (TPR) repeat protein
MLDLDPLSVIGRLNAITWLAWLQPERAMVIAQSIMPQSPWASHVALARVYAAKSEVDRELEQLLFAYALDAGDLLVNYSLASLLVNLGLLDEALRVAREVRPWALLEAGLFTEAEAELREVLALDDTNMELISSLASSLYYQGRYSEAAEVWRDAIVPTVHGDLVYSNGGNLPTAQLVYSLRQSGQEEAAARYLGVLQAHQDAIGEFAGRNPGWNVGSALLKMMTGDRKAAIDSLQRAVTLGLASATMLEEPILVPLSEEPAVRVMRETLANRAAQNREKALTLICDNNPVPDHWRPLEATCATRGEVL